MIPVGFAAGALGFFKANWKPIAGVGIAIAAWWAFDNWRDNLVEAAEKRGFGRAEQQYKAAVDAANKREEEKQKLLDTFALNFGKLAIQRDQQLTVTVQPILDKVKNEIATDPVYRSCRVSDGVRDDINTVRATVDAGIAAAAPRGD